MFSSLSTFNHSFITDSFYFTDTSVKLFSSSNADNSDELNTHPSSPASTKPVSNVDIVPTSHHSTKVSNSHAHINDYHCYSSIKTPHGHFS